MHLEPFSLVRVQEHSHSLMNIPQSRYSCLFKQCDSMGSIHLITPKHQHPTDLSKLKWRTTARKLNMKLSNLQFDITAVSPFLSLFSMKEWHLQTLAGCEGAEGNQNNKMPFCCFPTLRHQQALWKKNRKVGFFSCFLVLGFLTCLSFQESSAGHEVVLPSVGVVWLEWSYSSSSNGYF